MNQWISTTLKAVIGASGTALLTPGCSRAQPDSPRYPYAIFELPTLGGVYSNGWALDDRGHVVGGAFLPGNVYHATVWTDAGLPKDLGTLGGDLSECRGINANGWIVGRSQTSGQVGFDFSAFLWHDGQMYNLGYLGGDFAEAYGINDHNQIVGWSDVDNSEYAPTHAFLWDHGLMTDLGVLDGGVASEAIAINNSGLIVGQSTSPIYGGWRAVIWENGKIRDLGTFREGNGGQGICIDVNEAGDVVGYADTDPHSYPVAFVYHNGRMNALPMMPGWFASYGWSINDHREVVGQALVSEDPYTFPGCIWEWHKPVRYLVDLIPPNSNWYIEYAIHNNNLGQITGFGHRLDAPDITKGYLITPIHQTIQLSRAQPGTAGAVNTLKVHGAMPGAQVTFIYGDKGGGSAIPGCTLEENALQIDSPIILATITANANGVAELRGYVPSGARGRTVLIQAFVQGECGVSQLVVQRFE